MSDLEVLPDAGELFRVWALTVPELEALVGDPVLTQHDDGTVTIAWPNDTAIAALVSRELVDQIAAEMNDLRRTFVTIRATLDGAP